MTDDRHACNKEGCEVSVSGICAEGHVPVESCPFYGQKIEQPEDESELNESPKKKENKDSSSHKLYSGEALSTVEVDVFLRWKKPFFIAVVGERDSGKTTLITSIYDRFLCGSFADYIFTGSKTLIAFEKRCHYSRVDSGLVAPDTQHTSHSDGLKFLHLALTCESKNNDRKDIMFSDRAGEMYMRSRGNSELVQELEEIKIADKIVILLDGKRVGEIAERHNALQSVRQTIRAFLDGGALDVRSKVQVITTKIDLLKHHPQKKEIDIALEKFKKSLVSDFSDRLAGLTFWDVSARDPNSELPIAHGVDKLLEDWMDDTHPKISRATFQGEMNAQFDKLLLRTPMEKLP